MSRRFHSIIFRSSLSVEHIHRTDKKNHQMYATNDLTDLRHNSRVIIVTLTVADNEDKYRSANNREK
jgi:hypothetical protein